MRAGLNGNIHQADIMNLEGRLAEFGVTYQGDGEWSLPEEASIESLGGDDWLLVLADRREYYVWSEDE